MGIEIRDRCNHGSLLTFCKLGKDGKREHLMARSFGLREVPLVVTEVSICGLKVERERIVDLSGDARALEVAS